MNRRRFIKSGLIFIPTVFSAGLAGSVKLAQLEAGTVDWMKRVIANGGHYTSLSVVSADVQNKLILPIGNKLLRWNSYIGGDLAACAVPFSTTGNALDSQQNFVAGDYTEATGLTGNGSSKYVITGFVPSTHAAGDNDWSCGVYVRTKTSGTDAVLGCFVGALANCILQICYSGTTNYGTAWSNAAGADYATGADSAGIGHYLLSRTATNSLVLYKNGVAQYSTATPAGSKLTLNQGIYVHGYNNAGGPTGYSSRALGGYHFLKGLSATEVAVLYNTIQSGNRVLGRQV